MFLCDQTHGRTNQLPIKIIFFSFEKHNVIIKQIMTCLSPRSIETLGEAILNLSGQIDSLLPEGPVIICLLHVDVVYQKDFLIRT